MRVNAAGKRFQESTCRFKTVDSNIALERILTSAVPPPPARLVTGKFLDSIRIRSLSLAAYSATTNQLLLVDNVK